MREISLDTETTGLSFSEGDRITEIGCVEIIDKQITGRDLHFYINPERELSAQATEISGLTYEFLKKFPTFKEIAKEFLDFVNGDRLVIHNAPFDMGFLNFELSKAETNLLDPQNVVDTLVMAKEKFPGAQATLDALCKRFSVDASARTKHGALIDAELLAEVYLHMSVEKFQKNLFAQSPNEEDGEVENSNLNSITLKPRDFPIPQTELEEHKLFLTELRNPIWYKFNKEEDKL